MPRSDRIVVAGDFGEAAVSQPPKTNAGNVSIVHSNLLCAWEAPSFSAIGRVIL